MKENLDRIAPYIPWLGLILLLAGAVVYVITRSFDLATNLLLGGGVIALLLYIVLRPDDVRRLAGGRQTRYSLSTTLSILFFAATAVLLYWIAYQNQDWRLDLTATNEFTPLAETVELLENFEEPIHVLAFYSATTAGRRVTASERLDSLAAVKPNLTYEFVDPNSDPILANLYEVTADSTLVFVRNRGRENEITSQASTTSDSDLHGALIRVINPTQKTAYFLTGHGEQSPEDFSPTGIGEIGNELKNQGFTVQQLNLALEGAVPEDAAVVVLMGQVAPMLPAEVAALNDYLSSGGAAFIARDVFLDEGQLRAEEDNLRAMLLDSWGIRIRPDFIVETELAFPGQQVPVRFLAADFGNSPIITVNLRDLGLFMNISRSVTFQEAAGVTHVELARTTENSWGETNLVDFPQFGQEDAVGPVAVAVSAENSTTGGRLVVAGDVDFMSNDAAFTAGNNVFFSNVMNWLAGDETALELSPRETINRQVSLTQEQLGIVQFVSCLTGPILVAIIGIVVWVLRRRTR